MRTISSSRAHVYNGRIDMAEDKIDVEKIMERIRQEIKDTGADKIPLSFEERKTDRIEDTAVDSDGSRLDEAVKYISYNYEVQPYQQLTGNPVKVFIKKAIRKTASFFFLPVVGQQNTLNFNYFLVSEAVRDQKKEIEELKKTVDELTKKAKEQGIEL